MTDEWQSTSLAECIEVKHGFAFKGRFIHDEQCGDILLTPGNFAIGGGFKADKFKYYDGPVPDEYVLREGDLLVSMTDLSKQADTLGYPAFVPSRGDGRRYLHNQRLGRVLIKSCDHIDRRFLQYLLRSVDYRQEVLAGATGTTVKHTSPERIRRFQFRRPPLLEQRAIAHILGTLDGKIELNRRMSATLEAMARALFKSWFVDFDPVRAKMEGRDPGLPPELAALFSDRLVECERGEVPEGWDIIQLPEVFEVNPIRPLKKHQNAPYLDMANMPTNGHAPDEVWERPFGSGMKFINGDTLVARITPCLENGKTAFVDFLQEGETGWGSTEYIVLRPKAPWPEEAGYLLARGERFRDFAIQSMTGTSGRQRVPASALEHFQFFAPTPEILSAFGSAVKPWFARSSAAVRETRTLGALRDTLLPKLISGELRVKDAETFLDRVLRP